MQMQEKWLNILICHTQGWPVTIIQAVDLISVQAYPPDSLHSQPTMYTVHILLLELSFESIALP